MRPLSPMIARLGLVKSLGGYVDTESDKVPMIGQWTYQYVPTHGRETAYRSTMRLRAKFFDSSPSVAVMELAAHEAS